MGILDVVNVTVNVVSVIDVVIVVSEVGVVSAELVYFM